MDLEKNNLSGKIEQIENQIKEKEEEKELEKIVKLSQKKIGWVIFWSILFPIGAYIYTGRWKVFFVFLGSLMLLGGFVGVLSENEEEAFNNGYSIGRILGPIAGKIN